MWEIRVLNGPQKGQSFPLSQGVHSIGRSPSCEITLSHPQISKKHARLEVYKDKIIIADMESRNGTFVNGVQIKSKILRLKDQISIYDIHLQIHPASLYSMPPAHREPLDAPMEMVPTGMSMEPHMEMAEGFQASEGEVKSEESYLIERFNKYLEEVALPAVYRLPEMMEAKWAMGILILAFATIVTFLSAIPATQLLKSSVEQEAQKRAVTIASAMARENRNAIANNAHTALNIQAAISEPGVNKALIVSYPDGKILAPASLVGQFASGTPFIYSAIKKQSQVVESLDNNLIGVSVPMKFYNPATGNSDVSANAILIYDMSSISVNSAQTTSLYIQIYAIALIFAGLLLFLIYKVTNHPILEINEQLDKALKGEFSNIESPYQLPSLQVMISNINSALNRMSHEDEEKPMVMEYDRSQELTHLVQLIGFGAMGVTAHDFSIAAINQEFEQRTGMDGVGLLNTSVEEITDQALKLSIKDLIDRAQGEPDQMTANELEIAGVNYEIVAQPVYGVDSISYYLIVILPAGESEEGVVA